MKKSLIIGLTVLVVISISGCGLDKQGTQSKASETIVENGKKYTIEIKTIEEKKVVAFLLKTSFAENRQAKEIPPFFHQVMEDRSLENVPNRLNDDQVCVLDRKGDLFDYYMGVEVSNFENVPEGMKTYIIPASKYVVVSFIKRGNKDGLDVAGFTLNKWIPENGYTFNNGIAPFMNYGKKFSQIYYEKGYAGNPVGEFWVAIK